MASEVEITCACGCGRKRKVRTADVARGWGRFFDKSCKAREQTRRTGKGAPERRDRGAIKSELARIYGVSQTHAGRIVRGLSRTEGT